MGNGFRHDLTRHTAQGIVAIRHGYFSERLIAEKAGFRIYPGLDKGIHEYGVTLLDMQRDLVIPQLIIFVTATNKTIKIFIDATNTVEYDAKSSNRFDSIPSLNNMANNIGVVNNR